MDIHDLKIFLMIAQACSVSGNTYRNGCKRYAQEIKRLFQGSRHRTAARGEESV